jgi:hypothetical protein
MLLCPKWYSFRRLAFGLLLGFGAIEVSSEQVHFQLEPRSVIESRLKAFRIDNRDREDLVHKWFAESGCGKPNLTEQPAKFGFPPNVICVLPGETDEVIVVGAHTDKVTRAGDGVVDNWSGASLLPSLFFSVSGEKRHHTFVFVGFTGEERGLVGSEYYVERLTKEQRARIEAMVNMDSLGLSPTKVWASHADKVLLDALASIAMASRLPVSTVNVDKIGTADSESFYRYHIPRITLHSLTQETLPVLHSANDKLVAIKMDDYYDSYHLIAEYLAYLDGALKPAASANSKSPIQ